MSHKDPMSSHENKLTIDEVSGLTAVSPRTIRFYIQKGLVDRPVKGQGGVFLRLPGGARAFLREAKGLRPGQPMLPARRASSKPLPSLVQSM